MRSAKQGSSFNHAVIVTLRGAEFVDERERGVARLDPCLGHHMTYLPFLTSLGLVITNCARLKVSARRHLSYCGELRKAPSLLTLQDSLSTIQKFKFKTTTPSFAGYFGADNYQVSRSYLIGYVGIRFA